MVSKKVDYISGSQLSIFQECQLKYKHIYIDGKQRPPGNVYTVYGTSIHQAIADYYLSKLNGSLITAREVSDRYIEYFKRDCATLPREASMMQGNNQEEGLLIMGEMIAQQYIEQFAHTIDPLEVEKEFTIELKSFGIIIHGYIDLITQQGKIIDHKTVGKTWKQTWNQKVVDRNYAMSLYAMAYRKLFGKEETGIQFHIIPRLPKFEIHILEGQRTEYEIMRVIRIMQNMKMCEKVGLFSINENACSTCDFNSICTKTPFISTEK